jgi:hypothetical protein
VLEWIYNTDSFIDHQRWCEVMFRILEKQPAHEEHALRLLNGRLLACFFSGEFNRDAAAWTDRVLALLTPVGFANEKLSVAITLLGCLERAKRWDDAELLAHKMEAMLESASPRLKILVASNRGRPASANRQLSGGARACAGVAGPGQRARLCGAGLRAVAILLFAALYVGDAAETDSSARPAAGADQPGQHLPPAAYLRQMDTWRDLQAGSPDRGPRACRRSARSREPQRHAGTISRDVAAGRDLRGLRRRHHAAACEELEALSTQAEAGSGGTLRANVLTLQAWRHLQAGRPGEARATLLEGWTLAAAMRYYQLIRPIALGPRAPVCVRAGTDHRAVFTAELIRRRRLSAPSAAAAQWPWALRITTLGRFAIEADGTPVLFAGKVPRKPLALLKALIAFGGNEVGQHHLIDALWPRRRGRRRRRRRCLQCRAAPPAQAPAARSRGAATARRKPRFEARTLLDRRARVRAARFSRRRPARAGRGRRVADARIGAVPRPFPRGGSRSGMVSIEPGAPAQQVQAGRGALRAGPDRRGAPRGGAGLLPTGTRDRRDRRGLLPGRHGMRVGAAAAGRGVGGVPASEADAVDPESVRRRRSAARPCTASSEAEPEKGDAEEILGSVRHR